MFDCSSCSKSCKHWCLNLMKDSFSVLLLVSLMFYQNWKLALFAILMMPLAGGLAKSLVKELVKLHQSGESSGNLATFLSEIFKGSKMIRIYQKEKKKIKS